MQFPTGKKERIEIAVIACIVAIGALFGLITFVIMPFRDSYRTCLQDINTLQTNLDAANSEIAKGKHAKEQCEEMRAALKAIDGTYILKEEYNNYNIKADEYLKAVFAANGIELDGVLSEGLVYAIPRIPASRLKSFVVPVSCTISGRSSYERLLALFRKIETDNPYMSISRVSISAQQNAKKEPTVQSVSFAVSWPIWQDPSIATNFLPLAEESVNRTNTASATGNKERRK